MASRTTATSIRRPYILWLGHGRWGDTALVGGKAAGLRRLHRARLPVPPGFVVTTEAYRRALSASSGDRLDHADAWTVPAVVAAAVTRAYRRLLADVPDDLLAAEARARPDTAGVTRVAVRSSATLEDLPAAAFAGLYVTGVGVGDRAGVDQWLRRCWASLHHLSVAAYRAEQQLDAAAHGEPAMAVVVQLLAPAVAAGVAYTADPLGGSDDQVRIEAAWGLGSSVVDGTVAADRFVVRRGDLHVVSRTIGHKDTAAIAAGGAPGQRVAVPAAERDAPSLDDHDVRRVAELALRAEGLTGQPVDVEWAVTAAIDGSPPVVWLVQSRPISAGATAPGGGRDEPPDGAPDSARDGARDGARRGAAAESVRFAVVWPSAAAAEQHWRLDSGYGHEPEPRRALERDIRDAFSRSRGNASKLRGGEHSTDRLWMNGYLYTRQVANGLTAEEREQRQRSFQAAWDACVDQGTPYYRVHVGPEVQARNAQLDAADLDTLAPTSLSEHLTACLEMIERHWTLHWMWGKPTLRDRLTDAYRELTDDDDAGTAVGELLAGIPNAFTETVDDMIRLARAVLQERDLASRLARTEPAVVLAQIAAESPVRHELSRVLERWGLRCGMGFGTHRATADLSCWREQPALVLAIVRHYIRQDLDRLVAVRGRAAEQRARRLQQVRAQLAGRTADLERFERWYAAALEEARIFEDHNYDIDSVSFSLTHLAVGACGRRLLQHGLLAAAEDVWYLHVEEVVAALAQVAARGGGGDRWSALVQERRALFVQQQRMTPPPAIGAAPAPAAAARQTTDDEGKDGDGEDQPALTDSERRRLLLRGTAGSPGVATGLVRIVAAGEAIPDVLPGEVLVSANAGPLWTPVFAALAGVVLDHGAVFQHAMVAAREFGVPGMVQCRDATATLVDGQRVVVDGARGLVLRAE